MYVLKLKSIILIVFLVMLSIIIAKVSFTKTKKIETISHPFHYCIVVDAGHGLPDGGASNGEIAESHFNLMIAKKLERKLEDEGYDVIMTREDENNIAMQNKTSSSIKAEDLNRRVQIINESEADFCVSIHLNKFDNSRYWGWQTFYKETSEEGKKLAFCIQEGMEKIIAKENKRTALKIDGIKIVDKTSIPVVIVECGFISNPEEAKLLQEESYQEKIVEGICLGIKNFYGEE